MKMVELREKTKEELTALLADEKVELDNLKFQLHQGKLKNVKELGKRKKDIARIVTLLHQSVISS